MDQEPSLLAYAKGYTRPVMLDDQRFHKKARSRRRCLAAQTTWPACSAWWQAQA
jgi:hypothetical protein